jgi:hypothetical protein
MSPRSKRRKVVAARPADAHRRAIGYIRVSTDEQARSGLGLDAQRAAITATRNGWDLVDVLADEGVSGTRWIGPHTWRRSPKWSLARLTY